MELRHLRYFKAVALSLSFSRAAERLHVAQPALSRQIKSLEDEIGVRLIERNRVRVQLTDAGQLFLTYVEKILAQMEMAVAAVQEVPQGSEGSLALLVEWDIPVPLFNEAVALFHQRFPRVDLDLREVPLVQHLFQVGSGKAHMGFGAREFMAIGAEFSFLPLLISDFVIAVSSMHRFAKRGSLSMQEFREESWIWVKPPDKDESYRRFLSDRCREAGFLPRFGRSTKTMEGLLGLVYANFGVAFVPRMMIGPHRPKGVCFIELTPPRMIEFGVFWRRQQESVMLRNFIEIMKSVSARQGLG